MIEESAGRFKNPVAFKRVSSRSLFLRGVCPSFARHKALVPLLPLRGQGQSPMKIDMTVFDRAALLANKSTMVQRHGAVIIKNGEIIGEGYNYHTNIFCHQWSVHSEVAALMSMKNKHKNPKLLQDAVMVVVRIGPPSKQGELKNSKPCERCREAIEKSGIKKVFYSC